MIKFPRYVRVLKNKNNWEGIDVGDVYPVCRVTTTMFAISTPDLPSGAYFMKEWGELVLGEW